MDDDGRYLMVSPRKWVGGRPLVKLKVVRGYQVDGQIDDGWTIVAEDPEPHRYAPWAKDDDGA